MLVPATHDYKPQLDDTLVRYRACADLIDCPEKKQVLELLCTKKNGYLTASKILERLIGMRNEAALKLMREMILDVKAGLTETEILEKPYRFVLEKLFWTKKEHVPENDPHWDKIEVSYISQ